MIVIQEYKIKALAVVLDVRMWDLYIILHFLKVFIQVVQCIIF